MDKVVVGDSVRTAAQELLCARLRGDGVTLTAAMVETARCQSVHLILAAAAGPDELKDRAFARLAGELREAALINAIRERILRELLNRLAAADVDALLLKGAGLAYTLYPSPFLRPRGDLDVMIAPAAIGCVESVLAAGGWSRAAETEGELVTAQRHFVMSGPLGVDEQLDLHWKISNPQLFRDAVSFEELLSRSIPVPALGSHARTLSTADALFVACLHRVAHHQDTAGLLWLWDIHLLASRLSVDERARFVLLAARESMRAVCSRGLELALARFRTANAAELIAALQPPGSARREPSARFLGGGLRHVDLLGSDFRALRRWRDRLALVAGHLFPPVTYIRSVYPRCPSAVLPLAYVHRIAKGAPEWFRRPTRP